MTLTEILKSLGYDPEQTGQLLKLVRDSFLQLNSFLQLPDDRLEKMGIPIAVEYAVRANIEESGQTPRVMSNTATSTSAVWSLRPLAAR